ncbi:hypothetical protein NW752_007952 [Fusarium irregulare]|uniref:Protein kinase domain-containing protein n=1 Tax=Fusarium irregulare TaxID=2494466 RepID=A0A9W8PXX4_9HYPO|nr:hypothetical protein NW752_007952 [Fusarium irregulare]KAJ4019773.1 hypothetical protein NW766_003532 [Fusarium irregulare]
MAFNASHAALSPAQTPVWSVIQFTFSDRNTHAKLVVMCNGKCFVIQLSAETFSESPKSKERYLFFLQVTDVFELDGVTVDDFWDWIVEPLLPIFRQLPTPDQTAIRTLDDFFNPETFVYTLQMISDQRVPQLDKDAEYRSPFGVSVPDELCASWKSFDPADVRIWDENLVGPPSHTPHRVPLSDGTVAFLKLVRCGDRRSLENELATYGKLDRAQLDRNLKISRLYGILRGKNGVILGLLLTFVDCERVTLSCATKPGAKVTLREKWATQIQDAVGRLHDAGIFWGDAKSDNVLVDINEDVWIVDFGGEYTEWWVPKTLVGTMEGDSIALERILEYVRN